MHKYRFGKLYKLLSKMGLSGSVSAICRLADTLRAIFVKINESVVLGQPVAVSLNEVVAHGDDIVD